MASGIIQDTLGYRFPPGIVSDLNDAYVKDHASAHKFSSSTGNTPSAASGAVFSTAHSGGQYVTQLAMRDGASDKKMHVRAKNNGTWGAWDPLVLASQINDSGRLLIINGSQVSVPSSENGATGVSTGTITLPAGVWLVLTCVRFSQNANGIRRSSLSTSAGTMSTALFMGNIVATGSGTYIYVYTPFLLTLGSETTYNLNAGQNSGSALNAIGYIRAYKLSI